MNNYTGDRMAFDMGKEMAEAEGVTHRDPDDQRRRRGQGLDLHDRPPRRGRQLLRHQGRRAASERGDDLEEVVRIGKKVNDVTRTMGVALTACTPPAKG